MPIDCQRSTSGGKGNLGMFIDRNKDVCATGIPSAQPDLDVQGTLQQYLLKDEVDALISDAIVPPPDLKPLPPLRHSIPLDNRHALYTDCYKCLRPECLTKFQTLVHDFKSTVYSSYWKQEVGKVRDPIPMLPKGIDIQDTTFGKKTEYHGRLYDIVMPKDPYPDNTPVSKEPGVQTSKKYCASSFNPELTFGHTCNVDKRGTYVKSCLTDDRIVMGNANHCLISSIQYYIQKTNQPLAGIALTPNDNITCVPEGYSFGKLKPPGNLPECLTTCELNPGREKFLKCLKALNTLRINISNKYPPTFFNKFYLELKYIDKEKSGWLPKKMIYDICATKFIRFDPALIEPLLCMWSAFDGKNIEYKMFVHVINYREPSPQLEKVPDISVDCLSFETTYQEMVKPEQEPGQRHMAGLPSGRYFDKKFPVTPNGCCRADRSYLPQESDVKCCLSPSTMTQLGVTHRDMYQKREPEIVRRVFEAAYGTFTDELFNRYYLEAAKKYHSQGWVCYETFRRALENTTNSSNKNVN